MDLKNSLIPGHKKRSRRHSSNGTKRRSKDSVTSDSGTGKKSFILLNFDLVKYQAANFNCQKKVSLANFKAKMFQYIAHVIMLLILKNLKIVPMFYEKSKKYVNFIVTVLVIVWIKL